MKIVYWGGTVNTEKMAEVIDKGIRKGVKNAEVINGANANSNIFNDEDLIILGYQSMVDEILEESEFEPFIEEIFSKISKKKAALFGSYGWRDEKWMREWKDRMIFYGYQIEEDYLIICGEIEYEDEYIDFGEKIALL
ncbi:flavodoxin domain-containing protein [Clostridium sp. UBA1056]|uniref:flavodoxin domain-containing protein n=1 Tax=unclassified Clostridium TaxID=2614128 RepID=UPI003217D1E9